MIGLLVLIPKHIYVRTAVKHIQVWIKKCRGRIVNWLPASVKAHAGVLLLIFELRKSQDYAKEATFYP
jgi:hypothetical protein